MLCEMQSAWPAYELVSPCAFPTTITITLRAPLQISLVICVQLNGFMHSVKKVLSKRVNSYIWPIDGTLKITATPNLVS